MNTMPTTLISEYATNDGEAYIYQCGILNIVGRFKVLEMPTRKHTLFRTMTEALAYVATLRL